MHAEVAAGVLSEVGYDEVTIARVRAMLTKKGLRSDPDVQTIEDVACMVFLKHHLADFIDDHAYEDNKLVSILRKTWKKMSPSGREAALELDLGERERALLERALC
jgi:hypothetical protein